MPSCESVGVVERDVALAALDSAESGTVKFSGWGWGSLAESGLAPRLSCTMAKRRAPSDGVGPVRDDCRMHHEMIETEIDNDDDGRYVYKWSCACGRKGAGRLQRALALAGFRRHLKEAVRRGDY